MVAQLNCTVTKNNLRRICLTIGLQLSVGICYTFVTQLGLEALRRCHVSSVALVT